MKRNLWFLTGLLVVVVGCATPFEPSVISGSIQSQIPNSDQPDMQRPQPHGKPLQDTVVVVP